MKPKPDPLPPNFADLPDEHKRVMEETIYRSELRLSHAHLKGSGLLKSKDKIDEVY